MGRYVGITFAALLIGVVVILAMFPDVRARLRRAPPGRPVAGPANPVLIGATGYVGYVKDGDAYVIDVAQGSTRRATKTGDVASVRVAPGGNFVSYARAGKLFVASADGSTEYEMLEGDRPDSARWASFNVSLVYSTASGALVTFDPRAPAVGQRVIEPAGSAVGPNVAWAASATRIAYERRRPTSATSSREGIWVVNTSAATPVASPVYLTSGTTGLRLCCWASNDEYLLFWQVPLDGEGPDRPGRLLMAAASGSEPLEVSPATLVLRGIVGAAGIGSVVPIMDGAGAQLNEGKSLVLAEPTRAPAGNLAVRRLTLEEGERLSPASPTMSSDGTQVAYSVGPSWAASAGDPIRTSVGRRVWVSTIDGRRKRSLLADATVPTGVSDDVPRWSRDGRTILFARRLSPSVRTGSPNRSGQLEVWVAYADGSNARRIVGGLEDPGVQPSGIVEFGDAIDIQP